jgi:hypothetical protein
VPAYPRAAAHSGILECEGVVEHSVYSNPGFYEINSDDPCNFDTHTPAGKKIIETCNEGDTCKLKASGTWAVDFYVEQVISVEKLKAK